MEELVRQLIQQGYLKTPEIIDAFRKVNRRDFLPDDLTGEDSANVPLPIGHGQTISQPLTVAFMFELLDPDKNQKILDIGSGSGWTTAMLAELVKPDGKVYAIERIAELKEFGQKNVAKYNLENVEFFCQDGSLGLPDRAPFDRIIVAAAALEVPQELKKQLKLGGRLVIPTAQQDIRLIKRIDDKEYEEEVFPGFVFVPLIKD